MLRRTAITTAILGLAGHRLALAQAGETLRLDYAYYNPVGLVLRDKGWLEEALKPRGVAVQWVLSQGSNRSLEFLNAGSLDIGSTASAASLIGRANGNPIKLVYAYSRPEWTALVTRKESPIRTVADLRGKRVAVTRGTDPFIFLLRSLAAERMTARDLTLVPLQHADGRQALERGDVDAWAGLDPFMAQAEVESGARLFHRNTALISAGVLNVREEYAQRRPEIVAAVVAAYERARAYAIANPAELQATLAAASRVAPEVAARQLERTDLTQPAIGAAERESLLAAGEILKAANVIPADTDVAAVARALIDDALVRRVAGA